MNFKPTRGNIIVKLLNKQKKTETGILLPDTVKNPHREAEVIAVSVGTLNMDGSITPHEVSVGDKIIVRNRDELNNEINIDGEMCILITDRDILAITTPE